MGDQVYAYRGQYSVYDDGWKDKSYGGGGDKVCRTVIYDRDGRHRTVSGCSPTDTTTTYVVKTDVTEHVRPPPPPTHSLVSDHRRGSPAVAEKYGSYEMYRRPASPYGSDQVRRPQEVDEFLTGVQIEASRVAPAARGHGYGGHGEYRKGNNYGEYSSDEYDDDDDEDDDYARDDEVRHYPRPISPVGYGGGGGGRASPATHGVGKLSFPTESIDEAVDYLKGNATARPYYGSTNSVQPAYGGVVPPRPYYGTNYQTSEHVKPSYVITTDNNNYNSSYGTVNKSSYDTKNHQTSVPVKPYGSSTTTETKYEKTFETVKPYSTSTTTTGNYGTKYNQAPEPVKPYGTASSSTTSTSTAVIDCYEAARKYNGKVIRT